MRGMRFRPARREFSWLALVAVLALGWWIDRSALSSRPPIIYQVVKDESPRGGEILRPFIKQSDRAPDRAAGESSIPLSSVVSTSSQKELIRVYQPPGHFDDAIAKTIGSHLDQIYLKTNGVGTSNIFIVYAPDITAAVAATSHAFINGDADDWNSDLYHYRQAAEECWLVVYLGIAGSSPPHWLVDAVSVKPPTIRFSYHRVKPGAVTEDIHQYFYWVPLGKLSPGVYQLELFDIGADTTALSRRVLVGD
jgi:hypothetical protein